MSRAKIGALVLLALGVAGSAQAQKKPDMTFFVTSANPGKGADLGGLAGADKHCQTLASAVRALGPWLGGILWSLSLVVFKSLGIPSGHQWVPFALPVMLAVGCLSIYGRLRIRECRE